MLQKSRSTRMGKAYGVTSPCSAPRRAGSTQQLPFTPVPSVLGNGLTPAGGDQPVQLGVEAQPNGISQVLYRVRARCMVQMEHTPSSSCIPAQPELHQPLHTPSSHLTLRSSSSSSLPPSFPASPSSLEDSSSSSIAWMEGGSGQGHNHRAPCPAPAR